MSNLLSQIESVEDLRKLPVSELPKLCGELRQFIIEQTAQHPGGGTDGGHSLCV